MYFTINSKDWQTLKDNYLDNTYYPVDFRWGTNTQQGVRNAGIRSRGTGSRSGEKPGLRLDFDRYTTGQTFLGLKSLIFRNSTQDPTNMHERIAMQLFRKLGLVAPREIFARLFVNNTYSGLYAIVESVDKQFAGKAFGSDAGYLYKYDYNVTDRRTTSRIGPRIRPTTCRCRSSRKRTNPIRIPRCSSDLRGRSTTPPTRRFAVRSPNSWISRI